MSPSPFDYAPVRAAITRYGRPAAFQRLIEASNARLRGPELDNGREIAAERSAIYHAVMADWAAGEHSAFGYDRPFAVVALGGTGRGEMTPCSDTDFAFLFDDVVEGNAFLLRLQAQVVHSDRFRAQCGFGGEVLPFNLDDLPGLEAKQRNSFLDMWPVYDPDGLADRFRTRIRDTYDPFEHFLHVSQIWRDRWGESIAEAERIDRFDIKNGGLRLFLAGIWTLAGKNFCHSHTIYNAMKDRRDIEAYGFLLRIRSFVHLRRGTCQAPSAIGNHAEDILNFEDFTSFGELLGPEADDRERFEFANTVRGRLLAARRRVDRFTWGVIGRELKEGCPIRPDSTIVYGTGGLRDAAAGRRSDPREKSRAALALLLASQRYGLPIDPAEMGTTFGEAGDWLVPVPELAELFYESQGSLADSFEFFSRLPGAEERLFPGYAAFECSIDERVMHEGQSLRGVLLRNKIRALQDDIKEGHRQLDAARNSHALADPTFEVSIPVEAALLEVHHLAAVRLALKTKRLPETPDDVAAREDKSRPLHERFYSGFSGIPLAQYYESCFREAGFSAETLQVARFLVENRRVFKEQADKDLMDERQVDQILDRVGHDESLLRALFVFTCADRAEWESEAHDPAQWFNIRELYAKARMKFQPRADPTQKLAGAGYSLDQLEILEDFGRDFFHGIYRHSAIRFGVHLLRLKGEIAANPRCTPRPKVGRIRMGASEIIVVAARDHLGIAAAISGTFWKHGIRLRQAHLFSATAHDLVLDFFHLAPGGSDDPLPGAEFDRELEEAILAQSDNVPPDDSTLPAVARNITLQRSTGNLFHLRAETAGDAGELIYVLASQAFRDLGANIHGLAAHTGRDHAWVSIYLRLPRGRTLEDAQEIVGHWNRAGTRRESELADRSTA